MEVCGKNGEGIARRWGFVKNGERMRTRGEGGGVENGELKKRRLRDEFR